MSLPTRGGECKHSERIDEGQKHQF